MEEDIPLVGPIRTPKKLQIICAEAIALYLATKSMLGIELYFSDPFSPDMHLSHSRIEFILEDLRAIKTWYWKKTTRWLGPSSSTLRTLISTAFLDILPSFFYANPHRERHVFDAFIYQVLFSHFTGSFPTKCCYPVGHLTDNLKTFLSRLGPFELLAIHDSCLKFGNANPYPVLLKNSPSLKRIFISSNLSSWVLVSLIKYCKDIEVIEMEISTIDPIEKFERLICQTFFECVNINELLKKAYAGEDVQRPFPKLRELYILSSNDELSCTLMFLLQHFYPDLKMSWRTKVLKLKTMNYCRCYKCLDLPFLGEKDKFHWDTMDFEMYIEEVQHLRSTVPSINFGKANYIEFSHDLLDQYSNPDLIDELMKNYQCKNLVFRYFIPNDNPLTESLYRIGPNLNELYLYGRLDLDEHVPRFLRIISTCINLKVLSLELLIEAEIEWNGFDVQLLKLERVCLALYFIKPKLTPKTWIPRELQNSENKSQPGHSNDPFQHVNSLSARGKKIVDAIDIIEEKMCRTSPAGNGSYNTVMYEKIFAQSVDYDSNFLAMPHQNRANSHEDLYGRMFKIPIAKRPARDRKDPDLEIRRIDIKPSEGTYRYGQFGLGFYGNGSHGVGYYGYGIDGFGFYGHAECGYGFYGSGVSGFGFYGPSIRRFMSGFDDDGRFIYDRIIIYKYNTHPKIMSKYDHTSKDSSDIPFQASRHHALKLEMNEFKGQENIGYCHDPEEDVLTSLLLSILSKNPNLKTLELPGIRLQDLKWLSHRRYLCRVNTLKISNPFSPEVMRILEDMPSLSLLIIDGLNGMSNFSKYKKFCSRADLKVKFYDTRLVCPSSSILDFDKRRLNL